MASNTKLLIENALQELIDTDEKVNINQVAKKAGVTNALIYNRYRELVNKINHAKKLQKQAKENKDNYLIIEKLQEEIHTMKKAIINTKENIAPLKEQNESLRQHIHQLYGMYDQVLEERNNFAERLKHIE